MSLARSNKQLYSILSDSSGNTVGISGNTLRTSVVSLPNVTIESTVNCNHLKTYTYSTQTGLSLLNNNTTNYIDISDAVMVNLFVSQTTGIAYSSPITLRLQVSDTSNFATVIDTGTIAGYISSSADIIDMRFDDIAAPYIRLKAENVPDGEFLNGTIHVFKYH
jgi:hypothetical protein